MVEALEWDVPGLCQECGNYLPAEPEEVIRRLTVVANAFVFQIVRGDDPDGSLRADHFDLEAEAILLCAGYSMTVQDEASDALPAAQGLPGHPDRGALFSRLGAGWGVIRYSRP
jgi:hypothetical protein